MSFSINSMISKLVGLTDEQWGGYAFYHEPLEHKFNKEQKVSYSRCACECGIKEAELLKEEYPDHNIRDIVNGMNLKLKTPDTPVGGGHVIFAQYTEPDEITIFRDCVRKAERLIEEKQLKSSLGALDIEYLLFAHELFHVLEYHKRKEIYTQTEKIELWKRPFSNKSKILCLSEMAAMAFAKELLGLTFSPYVMDVLLMYGYNEEAACALYEEIIEAAEAEGRKEEC